MQLVYKTRGHPRAKHLVYVVVAGSKRLLGNILLPALLRGTVRRNEFAP